MDTSNEEAQRQLSELSVQAVDKWTGPGDYGFDLAGRNFTAPFFLVTVAKDHSITTSGESVTAAEPGGLVFEDLIVGVLEAAVPNDPVL
jgi:hypothetical protein